MAKPYTINQIKTQHPNVPKTAIRLKPGHIGNSMNGGHNKAIYWKKVMAGEKHYQMNLRLLMQMLTPKTPVYGNELYCTFRTYFVPNSRVWKNAEKYTAQKGGTAVEKIEEIPNIGGKSVPSAEAQSNDPSGENLTVFYLDQTTAWRDSFISSYIPRTGTLRRYSQDDELNKTYPKINALLLRGRIAIFNDYERNKEYDEERIEFNDDTVSYQEFAEYSPEKPQNQMRAKRMNSYYTDYRTEYQGLEAEAPDLNNNQKNLIEWLNWENLIAEARSQAENAQLNDWEIIAKIRGSKLLTEGKVQLIGTQTVKLNYSAITQSTYNNNETIDPQFRVMGKQGAYSYTEINVPLYAGFEFNEEGFIHVIATVQAESIFESGIDRNLLNVTPLDEYRPDLIEQKFDVIYKNEFGTTTENINNNEIYGFKRKFNEYFKMPNVIGGDLTSNNYYQSYLYSYGDNNTILTPGYDQVETQKTFQFYERDAETYTDLNGNTFNKKYWLDYTDILINKNQAVMNKIGEYNYNSFSEIQIEGQNQIFFAGTVDCYAELPIDDSIVNNYLNWGEH